MKSIPYLYVNEETAKELGCTHESTLFGIPGYSYDSPDEDAFEFIPKLYPLQWVCQALDKFLDFASYFVVEPLQTPIKIIRPLE